MIERVLRGVPEDVQVIVVGEYPSESKREVIVTREEPAGGGPLAALAAGLVHVTHENFLLLATDMPFVGDIGVKLVKILEDASGEVDAVIPVDADGRAQPLCAAYRTRSARAALARLGDSNNRSMKSLLAELQFQNYEGTDGRTLSDVDTITDLEEAETHARAIEGARSMDEWIAEVKATLGLDAEVDVDLLLNVARDAAHNVMRPAAPVTTYLLGLAVANGADAKTAGMKIQQLATSRNISQGD